MHGDRDGQMIAVLFECNALDQSLPVTGSQSSGRPSWCILARELLKQHFGCSSVSLLWAEYLLWFSTIIIFGGTASILVDEVHAHCARASQTATAVSNSQEAPSQYVVYLLCTAGALVRYLLLAWTIQCSSLLCLQLLQMFCHQTKLREIAVDGGNIQCQALSPFYEQ